MPAVECFRMKLKMIGWLIIVLVVIHIGSVRETQSSDVQWRVKQQRVELGKPLNLTCQFSSALSTNLSRQWTIGKHNRVLCQDNVTFIRTKYEGRINSLTEYVLTINNLTEHDLEYVYSCRIGFQYEQKQIELNKINFVHTPETKIIKYQKQNGSHSLHLELGQVFPKPLCWVKLQMKNKNLTIMHEEKQRVLYNKVTYEIISDEPLHDCGETVEIECVIGRKKFNISHEHNLHCKTNQDDERDQTDISIIGLTLICVAALLLPPIAIIITVLYRRRKKLDRANDYGEVYNEDVELKKYKRRDKDIESL